MPIKTTPWNVQDSLKTSEDCWLFLQAALEEAPDDSAFITKAIGEVARSQGMTQLATTTGLTREGLYKALAADGNPSFSTILKVLKALGLRLQVAPLEAAHAG
jgi:probable addiction module antidote protein